MSDVEKLKEAIGTLEAYASNQVLCRYMDHGVFCERVRTVVEAARSTLPKMKTVEFVRWDVIDREGDTRRSCLVESQARVYAAEKNASDSNYKPYTVVCLTGTAEIPA